MSLIMPAITYGFFAFALAYSMWPYFYYVKNNTLIVIGLFAAWRYGWLVINYTRSIWYAFVHFPRLRRIVDALPEGETFPDHVFFVIMSYAEEPWVSVESIQSIMSNLSSIPSSATLIVSTGSQIEDGIIMAAYQAHPVREKVKLIIQHQSNGKRIAMGHALRAIARRFYEEMDPSSSSVTLFMDGDSFLPPYTLKRTLPFFVAFPKLGALTTNETAYINTSSRLYKDWFNLKFGQRHVLFQSHSLSHKVLTLTGRFSMMRTSICVDEDFICQVENDILTHWLHGKFRFLMGDDKSTWFYLLKKNWEMLYIPDVSVISLESRDDSFLSLSRDLPYRWYGNTLRNNGRALALGPRQIGWFIWVAILDQRLTMWTALVGITGATLLSFSVSFVYLPLYIAWVLMVRIVQLAIIAFTGHPVSMRTIPLMLYNQWMGAFVKIKAQYHLADQKWAKGGKIQRAGTDAIIVNNRMIRWLPNYIMYLSVSFFAFLMLLNEGVLRLPPIDLYASESAHPVFLARMYGIKPNDGKDDAYALGKLISWVPSGSVVSLPSGQLDFFEPLLIKRGTVEMKGVEGTAIVSHIHSPGLAVIDVQGTVLHTKFKLADDLKQGAVQLKLTSVPVHFQPGTLLQLSTPNDNAFFDKIHSQKWRKNQPWIRQTIVSVQKQQGVNITLAHMTGIRFPAATTRVRVIRPVKHLTLSHFSMRQKIPGHKIQEVNLRFENVFPKYAVDGIRLKYVDHCLLEHLFIQATGRHPVNLEQAYACKLTELDVDGAWNKGKKGNGYIRIARSYHNDLSDSRIKGIRHITLQWSSAFNKLSHLETAVDINFHGGYAHHNKVDGIYFTHEEGFKWNAITRTKNNAHWAPPDGPKNIAVDIKTTQDTSMASRVSKP